MNNKEFNEIQIYTSFALAFAKNSLPYSLIKNNLFIKALHSINNNFKLSKSKLKEFMMLEGNRINENILNMLSVNEDPVTIALDGWTNVRSNKVTNILLICSGISYFYTSIENKDNLNNANWLVPVLTEKISFLINKKINVVAITTDNENLMKFVRNKISETFPILIVMPCSAHILQLCLKQICKIDTIKSIIDKTLELVNCIKRNKAKTLELLKLQKKDAIEQPLKLIRPIEIRWTSLATCVERLLSLKKYIDEINFEDDDIKCDETYWDNLKSLYEILEPFYLAINKIQKDTATLYSVWNNFEKIINLFESGDITQKNKSIAKEIVDTIKNQWNNHINNDLIEAVRLLNLEKKFKFKKSTIEFIVNWGSLYLTTYDIVEKNKNGTHEIGKIRELLNKQINEFTLRQNSYKYINSDNEKLKKEYEDEKESYSVILLWNRYKPLQYEFANVAIAILSICPSEASVERSFSMQSDVHTLERNRLSNKMIEAEMNIKYNYS